MTKGEPIYGIAGIPTSQLDMVISTPGRIQEPGINRTNRLVKVVDITPFDLTTLNILPGLQSPSAAKRVQDRAIETLSRISSQANPTAVAHAGSLQRREGSRPSGNSSTAKERISPKEGNQIQCGIHVRPLRS